MHSLGMSFPCHVLMGPFSVLSNFPSIVPSSRVEEGPATQTVLRSMLVHRKTDVDKVQRHALIPFFKRFFLMWTIFKVFIEFAAILLLFYVLVFWPQGMWNLSFPTRDGTRNPCIGRQRLKH